MEGVDRGEGPTTTTVPTPDVAVVEGTPRISFDQKIAAATAIPFAFFLSVRLLGGLPVWLAALTLFLGAPHVLATIGLYVDRDIRTIAAADPVRYLVVPLAAIPVSVVVFGVTHGAAAVLAVTAFLAWQTQHYTKQNIGMFAFWCRARGLVSMRERERSLVRATTAVGVLGILRAMALAPGWDRALQVGGLALVASGALVVATSWEGRRSVALLAALAFYLALHLFRVDLLGAAFAYQAAHGAQYYLMVGQVIRRNPLAVRVTIPVVLLGGVVPLAALTASAFATAPLLFGFAKGVAAAHFLADASLWRLRRPEIRRVMATRFPFL